MLEWVFREAKWIPNAITPPCSWFLAIWVGITRRRLLNSKESPGRLKNWKSRTSLWIVFLHSIPVSTRKDLLTQDRSFHIVYWMERIHPFNFAFLGMQCLKHWFKYNSRDFSITVLFFFFFPVIGGDILQCLFCFNRARRSWKVK